MSKELMRLSGSVGYLSAWHDWSSLEESSSAGVADVPSILDTLAGSVANEDGCLSSGKLRVGRIAD